MSEIEFRKDHGDNVEADWQRVLALQEICDQVDGVTTAKPRSMDVVGKLIVYEHVDFPTPIIQFVGNDHVFERAGRLLARMHRARFTVDRRYFSPGAYPLAELGVSDNDAAILQNAIPSGWFHADFWHGNVFCEPDGAFVIIDPVPARFTLSPNYIFGCGALDVASMYMGLLFCHPLQRQARLAVGRYLHSGEVFIDAYLEETGVRSSVVSGAVHRLSRFIALRFIGSYAQRLAPPLASIKHRVAMRILRRVDNMIDWGNK